MRPEQVVEIAFDGVQRSTRYPGGMALRFARVVRYRDDKATDGGGHDRGSPGLCDLIAPVSPLPLAVAGSFHEMEFRTLGRSGCAVSRLCLGAMTFGAESDEATSHALLDAFVAAGGNFVDTADVYSAGASEEIIGRWLAARPAEVTGSVVLATKGRFATDDSPNGAGLSARHLTRALDASLRRLGVDAVDLYQVHAFDPWTPLEETLRVLDGFVRAGKIRYYGLSNFTGWQLTKAVHLARQLGARRAGDACSRSTACWRGRSSGRSCRLRRTRGSGCCRGVRSVAGGCRASIAAASVRPVRPDWVRIQAEVWRRGSVAEPSTPGT